MRSKKTQQAKRLRIEALSFQFDVRVTPRANKDSYEVLTPEKLKVTVRSAPVDGEANEAVVALIASTLSVARSRVSVIRGHSSREKQIAVEVRDQADLESLRAKLFGPV